MDYQAARRLRWSLATLLFFTAVGAIVYKAAGSGHWEEYHIWIALLLHTAGILLAIWIAFSDHTILSELKDRLFGTMRGFHEVDHRVLQLIEEANERKDSKLFIMVYWLWFGADEVLAQKPDFPIDQIKGNHSRMRQLLATRREEGRETILVLYDPEAATTKLQSFILAAFKWQRARAHEKWFSVLGAHDGHAYAEKDATGIASVLQSYSADVADWERERLKKPDTQFQAVKRCADIPMLMFAAHDPGTRWSRGLIYLGEKEALAADAETGGFYSEDGRIVQVIISQIRNIASRIDGSTESAPPAVMSPSTTGIPESVPPNTGGAASEESTVAEA